MNDGMIGSRSTPFGAEIGNSGGGGLDRSSPRGGVLGAIFAYGRVERAAWKKNKTKSNRHEDYSTLATFLPTCPEFPRAG